MSDRSKDWLAQAERDIEQAKASRGTGRHEWACFAAHQAAEKAVKALHLSLKQEAWGHVVARLLKDLPIQVPDNLVEKARFWMASICRRDTPTATRKDRLSSTTVAFRAPKESPMPQRSLNSRVLKWPDRDVIDRAVRAWAQEAGSGSGLRRVGYFGLTPAGTGGSEAIWIWWRSWTVTLSRLNAGRCGGISMGCPFRRKSSSTLKPNGSTCRSRDRDSQGCCGIRAVWVLSRCG